MGIGKEYDGIDPGSYTDTGGGIGEKRRSKTGSFGAIGVCSGNWML